MKIHLKNTKLQQPDNLVFYLNIKWTKFTLKMAKMQSHSGLYVYFMIIQLIRLMKK